MPFTCPRCGMTSHHPEDERRRYCAACKVFLDAEIRAERAAGEGLGLLVDRYGAAAVVSALGIRHIKVTVHIPRINRFTVDGLRQLMIEASRRGKR